MVDDPLTRRERTSYKMGEHCVNSELENNIANHEHSYVIPIEEESCSKESELVVGRRIRETTPVEHNSSELENCVEHIELEEYPYLISIEEMSCSKVSELVITSKNNLLTHCKLAHKL